VNDDPIPAATLIVVRDRPGGAPELLMVERAQGMAFAAGAMVFPGGRIDPADRDMASVLGVDGAAVAAVRETLEETAIPVGLTPLPAREKCLELQQALAAEQGFGPLLEAAGLALDAVALVPFARWVPKGDWREFGVIETWAGGIARALGGEVDPGAIDAEGAARQGAEVPA
jgi:8-oxo-dGTP pyrophosphatase MutT (NUDIX family)